MTELESSGRQISEAWRGDSFWLNTERNRNRFGYLVKVNSLTEAFWKKRGQWVTFKNRYLILNFLEASTYFRPKRQSYL